MVRTKQKAKGMILLISLLVMHVIYLCPITPTAQATVPVQLEWVRQWRNPVGERDVGIEVEVDAQRVYCLGKSENPLDEEEWTLLRFDAAGNEVWNWTLGHSGDFVNPKALAIDAQGMIYVGGRIDDQMWVLKFNKEGQIIGNLSIGPSFISTDIDITVDSEGRIYILLKNANSLSKFLPNGTLAWTCNLKSENWDYFNKMKRDPIHGAIYCVGALGSTSVKDIGVVKVHPNGTILWRQKLADPGIAAYSFDVEVDSTGSVYAVGARAINNIDLVLVKFYPNGTIAWNITYGDPMDLQIGWNIELGASGAVYCLAGVNKTPLLDENEDMLLLKYHPNGTLAWDYKWTIKNVTVI